MYELDVQAFVNGQLKFMYMIRGYAGSTFDSAAFEVAELAKMFLNYTLNSSWWIAGDAENSCIPGFLPTGQKAH